MIIILVVKIELKGLLKFTHFEHIRFYFPKKENSIYTWKWSLRSKMFCEERQRSGLLRVCL